MFLFAIIMTHQTSINNFEYLQSLDWNINLCCSSWSLFKWLEVCRIAILFSVSSGIGRELAWLQSIPDDKLKEAEERLWSGAAHYYMRLCEIKFVVFCHGKRSLQ